MRGFAGSVLALSLCVGCGGSPTRATSTSPPPTGNALVAAFDVKADAAGSRDAVASLSEVIVDASKSTGTGLSYAIDFGDGSSATTASATHVYAAPSTYTVVITVTDSEGRKASATTSLSVRDATGNWFHASYVGKTKRVEVRRLTIEAQSGTTVRGTYRVTGDVDRTFTGTLIPPRDIRMNADRGVMIEGTLPGRLNDEATLWTLITHGDSADGQRLDFRAADMPEGAPPAAEMTVQFGTGGAAAPIPSVTPIHIDGTASRGAGLAYFIEFGDGTVTTASGETRVVDMDPGPGVFLTARLTVVDRFGRSDSRSFPYLMFAMGMGYGYWNVAPEPNHLLYMSFGNRSGRNYSVTVDRISGAMAGRGEGSATLGTDGSIVITVPAWGVEYRGTVMVGGIDATTEIRVLQQGGPDDGRTWRVPFRSFSTD